jgi:hypothetical protein
MSRDVGLMSAFPPIEFTAATRKSTLGAKSGPEQMQQPRSYSITQVSVISFLTR